MRFDEINHSDFTPQGDLRSRINFRWIGEISGVQVKRYSRMSRDPGKEGEVERESFFIELSDKYGFSCSFFKRNMSQESAMAHACKVPYGVTLFIDGDVKVRRGRTYFDATKLFFPDETPVFVWGITEEGEEENVNV